jgi:hypothetical protein
VDDIYISLNKDQDFILVNSFADHSMILMLTPLQARDLIQRLEEKLEGGAP